MPDKLGTVLAASIGDCVHVAGVTRFLAIAEDMGYETYFTGPATELETFVDAIVRIKPNVIGISYRLTPENARLLFDDLGGMLAAAGVLGTARIFFGGTPPVAVVAREYDFIDHIFSGQETGSQIQAVLRGNDTRAGSNQQFPQQAVERILWKVPYPILRHHFGLPAQTIEPTVAGIREIAEAQVLDVLSLGADQDAQENFFHPLRQDPRSKGAGVSPSVLKQSWFNSMRQHGTAIIP